MNRDSLKKWLRKQLRMDSNPDRFERLWGYLEKDYIIEEWEQDYYDHGRDGVLVAARDQLERARTLGDSSSSIGRSSDREQDNKSQKQVEVQTTGPDNATANALAVHFAAQAANLPEVRRYRQENLPNGRLLAGEEEVLQFLASQSPVVEEVTDGLGYKELRQLHVDRESLALLALDPEYARYDSNESLDAEIGAARNKGKGMSFDEIVGLLVRLYPWRPEHAAMFLLAGERPEVETLTAEVFPGGMVAISALYWVSEESVIQAFRRARRFVVSGHKGRSLHKKTRDLFRFVAEQTEKESSRPSWETLRRRWNEAYPDDKFQTRNGFRNTYKRAEARVACRVELP